MFIFCFCFAYLYIGYCSGVGLSTATHTTEHAEFVAVTRLDIAGLAITNGTGNALIMVINLNTNLGLKAGRLPLGHCE